MNELTQRVSNIIKCVCKDLYDREDVVRIVVLTILAGQNVFLFGPPGTGKSMISRKVAGIFENSKYYEHLMHRFCTPEELFGPVSFMTAEWIAHNLAFSMATGSEEEKNMIQTFFGKDLRMFIKRAKELDLSTVSSMPESEQMVYHLIETVYGLNSSP